MTNDNLSSSNRMVVVWCVYCAGLFLPGLGQLSAADATAEFLGCLVALEVPWFSNMARYSPRSEGGTVQAVLTVGSKGEVRSLALEGGNIALQTDVQIAVTDSRFRPACAGRQFAVKFTYIFVEPPHEHGFPSVRFEPPNHFVLRARRLPTRIEPPRPTPERQ